MENVIAHRNDETFATTARASGKVIEINDDAIVVEYDNPEHEKHYAPIGLRHGVIAGMHVPHRLRTELKVGDTFKEGDALSFNDSFFVPDPLVPGQLIYKGSMLVRTLLIETTDTLEDSSAMSARISEAMTTSITYPEVVVVSHDEVIHDLIEPGTAVDIGSILCIIENPITANAGLFDDETYSGLAELAAPGRKSDVAGIVDNIEVFYNGDPDNFNESLARIIRTADKRRALRKRNFGGKGVDNGRVNERNTIQGRNLQPGQVAIVINITTRYNAGVGDKGVTAHQLKTTVGRVMTGVNTTEDGVEIDLMSGYTGISDRIVNSPEDVGTTNTLCLRLGELTVEAYRN